MKRLTAACLTAALALFLTACADTSKETGDDYPTKPVSIIVGYDAGGPTDTGARLLAKELEKKLDTTVTIKNKPGANSQLAYTELAKAEPDGYTMAAITFPSAIVTVLDKSRGASYTRDSFAPVALQVVDPTAVAVAPDSKYETPSDLVNAAKKAPGKLTATTTGVGSNEHFALLRLEQVTGAKLQPVHFAKGGAPATTAFLGGDVDVLVANVSDLEPLVKSGKAKVVGVMDTKASPLMPDVPTFAEQGYDVAISSSRGYAFPAGTPKPVVDAMSDAIGDVMADKAFQQKMEKQGLAPTHKDAKAYTAYWDETTKLFQGLLPLVKDDD